MTTSEIGWAVVLIAIGGRLVWVTVRLIVQLKRERNNG